MKYCTYHNVALQSLELTAANTDQWLYDRILLQLLLKLKSKPNQWPLTQLLTAALGVNA